jgi:hypothetical protein
LVRGNVHALLLCGLLLLDVVVSKRAAILKPLVSKDEPLLVWGNALLILDLGLDIGDGARGLHLKVVGTEGQWRVVFWFAWQPCTPPSLEGLPEQVVLVITVLLFRIVLRRSPCGRRSRCRDDAVSVAAPYFGTRVGAGVPYLGARAVPVGTHPES